MHLLGVTQSPAADWAIQLTRGLAVDLHDAGCRLTHLIRDRDAKFTAAFDAVFTSIGVTVMNTSSTHRGRTPCSSAMSTTCAPGASRI